MSINEKWPLARLMASLHNRVSTDLKEARDSIGHPGAKGDGSERVWQRLFKTYLPGRYAVDKATIMDSAGGFSQEIDVVLYDRQYSFLIFELEGTKRIPVTITFLDAAPLFAFTSLKECMDAEVHVRLQNGRQFWLRGSGPGQLNMSRVQRAAFWLRAKLEAAAVPVE